MILNTNTTADYCERCDDYSAQFVLENGLNECEDCVVEEFGTLTAYCPLCDDSYSCIPWGGYCDGSLECANDMGDSLVYSVA